MKKLMMLCLTLILMLTIGVPVAAKTVIQRDVYAELAASNGQYTITVSIPQNDLEHLYITVIDSDGNILVDDKTLNSSDLFISSGKVVLTVPEYSITLTWAYNPSGAQIGKVFITKFPDLNTKRFRQFVSFSDSSFNETTASGILLGNEFASNQAYVITVSEKAIQGM